MLPDIGYVRVWQIVGCARRKVPAVIPVSRATWWAGVASGKYPKSVKLGPGTTAWKVEDIRELVARMGRAA